MKRIINSFGLKNTILTFVRRKKLSKFRLFEKIDTAKLSLANFSDFVVPKGDDRWRTWAKNLHKKISTVSAFGGSNKGGKNANNDCEGDGEDGTADKIITQKKSGKTKTVTENACPTAKESNPLSESMQTHISNQNQLLKADANLTKEGDLKQLKISQLRAQLRLHGLSAVGKKDVLVQRLQSFLQLKAAKSIVHLPFDQQDYQGPTTAVEEMANSTKKSIEDNEATTRHVELTHETQQTEINDASTIFKSEREADNTADKQPNESPLTKLGQSVTQAVTEQSAVDHDESRNDSFIQATNSISDFVSTSEINRKCAAGVGDGDGSDDGPDEKIPHHSTVSQPMESAEQQPDGDVYVEYIQGLPHLTVPLPSRLEKCRFALRPVSHKVGDLIEMLKIEDHGIDRAVVLNKCGVRIASTCAIDSLMDEPFWLQINDNKYEVIPPKRKKIDSEDLQRLGDVRTLVAQLYEALHVGEYHLHKEQDLVNKIENLKFEIAPLEMEKQELTKLAERKTVIATWVGLSLMAMQFGVLARLTWWEYSWDIMEPVTYFVTYGTTMAMYAYYCLTKSEYNFETARQRLFLISIHKKAKRKNFDVEKYNILKREIAEAEYDLRRLRDPINLQLPPHIDRSQRITPIEPASGGGAETRLLSAATCEKKPVSFRLPFLEPKN